MFEVIQRMLCSSQKSCGRDLKTFKDWEDGKISIFECYMRFKSNNHVNNKMDCSISLFEKWLNSIGYER